MTPAAPESLAPKLARCQAEVDAAFARVAEFLDSTRPGVTVHTADLAHPGSPWSLAWCQSWKGYCLMIVRFVGQAGSFSDWAEASPAARLATLSHLSELLARIARAVADLARMADRSGETIGQVEAALAIAKGEG